jgi:hypothetical protein
MSAVDAARYRGLAVSERQFWKAGRGASERTLSRHKDLSGGLWRYRAMPGDTGPVADTVGPADAFQPPPETTRFVLGSAGNAP